MTAQGDWSVRGRVIRESVRILMSAQTQDSKRMQMLTAALTLTV